MRNYGVAAAGLALGLLAGARGAGAANPYSQWPTDALDNVNFFPIGVWFQSPTAGNGEVSGYAGIHINTFVYLDPSTSTSVMNSIAAANMHVIMPYSASLVNNPTVIAWFAGPDEPDNAQSNGSGGFTDPVLPATQIAQYQTIKSQDNTKPVYEGFGQGVAWTYNGRGSRTGDFQDYPATTSFKWTNGVTYTQGYEASTDISAFDFYPENATNSAVAGKTSVVGTGVKRLVTGAKPGSPVWNTIETTQISAGSGAAPTPGQVKAEAWISLVNGSTGIIYFAHTISPFDERGLLDNPTMSAAVSAINSQVESLAPELNSDTITAGTIATGKNHDQNVQFMTKEVGGNEYLFAVTAQDSSSDAALFADPALAGLNATVQVLGESRTINMVNGRFTDNFAANTVHLYELANTSGFVPELAAPTPEPATLSLLLLGGVGLLWRRRRVG